MKHLFLALMLTIGFGANGQVDGLFAFTLDSYQDTLFSMYNVAPNVRDELKSYLIETAHGYDIVDGVWLITLPDSNSRILGELFLTITEKCVLFDFYVDEVKYSNGTSYHEERFKKPLRVVNNY